MSQRLGQLQSPLSCKEWLWEATSNSLPPLCLQLLSQEGAFSSESSYPINSPAVRSSGRGSSWPSHRYLLLGLFHSQALQRQRSPGPNMMCPSYPPTTCRSFRGHATAGDGGRETKTFISLCLSSYMQLHLLL